MVDETRKLEMTPAETMVYERLLQEVAQPGITSIARTNRLSVLAEFLDIVKTRNGMSTEDGETTCKN